MIETEAVARSTTQLFRFIPYFTQRKFFRPAEKYFSRLNREIFYIRSGELYLCDKLTGWISVTYFLSIKNNQSGDKKKLR